MHTVMKVKCFILFFAMFVTRVKPDIDFMDCGSLLEIKKVKVSNCTSTPCAFSPGDHLTVELMIPEIQLNKTELFTEAYLYMFGQRWPLEITPIDPCSQWNCPLRETSNLTYVADIHIQEGLIKRPADVMLQSSYDNGGTMVVAICVQFDITLQ